MAAMRRLVVGVTGASGIIYAARLLEVINGKMEIHLVVSEHAHSVILAETDFTADRLRQKAAFVHEPDDLTAPVASGSFQTDGMVIVPCSINTLSAVANSSAGNLIVRAADIALKERRRLILVVRETPLHTGHIQLMERVSIAGGIILPPVPAFYHNPQTVMDVVDHTIGKILDLLGIEHELYARWGEGQR